jgi:raffinose/stachyose/melibiose transport system substrate-binding protein
MTTRFITNDVPDVFSSIPIEEEYVTRASNGYLLDITDEDFINDINPEVQDRFLVDGKMYGAGYSLNANGVYYNKNTFAEHGLEVPETWDELTNILETLDAADETPVIMSNQWLDQSTVLNLHFVAEKFDPEYWERFNNGEESIQGNEEWIEVAEKTLEVVQYAQNGHMGTDQDQGNEMFVDGQGALLFNGSWAIEPLRGMHQDFDENFGYFPFPQTNNPEDNVTISGIDVGLTISADTEHPEEALRFVSFLIEHAQDFVNGDYVSVSAVEGIEITDEVLSGLAPHIDNNQTANWPNHYWRGGSAAETDYRAHTQNFFNHGDIDQYLSDIETMFEGYRN